jgi:cytochrome c
MTRARLLWPLVAWALLLAALAAGACRDPDLPRQEARAQTGGDPERGRRLVSTYGCGACHVVPGVPGASGTVGPPLEGTAGRSYLAGRLANTPDNLKRWIEHPRQVDSKTAMPELGVSEQDARDLAAYLETLR